jgi:[ribosomal protein S5]-alanine N-acetyltransferase
MVGDKKHMNIPESILTLETDRLLLRKMSMADVADIFAYASDSEVSKYTSWPTHQAIADSQQFLESVIAKYEAGQPMDWGIEHKRDRKLIGTCGFASWEYNHARAEIGYVLSRQYWGQGYMTEAVKAVIAFGFHVMMLNRIQATCMVDNLASARVMQKAGMHYEGTLQEYAFFKDRYCDLKVYATIKSKTDFTFDPRSLISFADLELPYQ